jgi:hypothetical protein
MGLSENINNQFVASPDFFLSLCGLYKRKQALLRSNLSGIIQMLDENVAPMGCSRSPLIFSESRRPEVAPILA